MATSNQYNFPAIDADYVVRDAFERCHIPNNKITPLMLESGKRSFNFLLSEWPNFGLNLFTVKQAILPLVAGQNRYEVPQTILEKMLECNLLNSDRMLGGEASSSAGGDASQPFLATPSGSCAQTSANGNISYKYPTPQPIVIVGVMSQVTANYTLSFDCSFLSSPSEGDWINLLNTPAQTYYYNQPIYYVVPYTKSAVNWRVRETGGGTLNISQIYFNIPAQSQPMVSVGRDLYFNYNMNQTQGTNTVYWFDRTLSPSLNVYPVTGTQYQFVIYNYVNIIQDINSFFDSMPVPGRFLNAACSGLAVRLAEKYVLSNPDLCASLLASSVSAYTAAGGEDTENVQGQIRIGPLS